MRADGSNISVSLKKAETFIRRAFEQGAELIILPESFTVRASMENDTAVVEAVRPLDGEPLKLLQSLAREHHGVIGGAFLAYKSGNIYNSFVLVFPDGNYFVHNKDYPTFSENCYYTGGSDDGVFETSIGRIGLAQCWEINRTATLKRMLGKVDIVLAASAWPGQDPTLYPNSSSFVLIQKSARTFSKMLGVPMIHCNQVGRVDKDKGENGLYYLGNSQIIDYNGEVKKEITFRDGEGIILDTVRLQKKPKPALSIPKGFWIYDIDLGGENTSKKLWFDSLCGPFREFYENTTRKHCLEKYLNQ